MRLFLIPIATVALAFTGCQHYPADQPPELEQSEEHPVQEGGVHEGSESDTRTVTITVTSEAERAHLWSSGTDELETEGYLELPYSHTFEVRGDIDFMFRVKPLNTTADIRCTIQVDGEVVSDDDFEMKTRDDKGARCKVE